MDKRIFPVEVNELDLTFGGDMKKLLPPMNEIPTEFQRGQTKWNKLINKWFFTGLKKLDVKPREGVDRQKALNHVSAIMRSFEPSHEHKEAACSYLMSQFFEDDFSFEVSGSN
ncbi:hypothetical protein [Paenibacillus sp. Y412MC10]|uniref:hypothetical protein n=1 Tax=Geobacillus sp. (strain Y412MC10) TaxID=481743 RepID=UPI0011A2174E|nr:hypothetical protein [Paenibacillus sp. Y412MC10]